MLVSKKPSSSGSTVMKNPSLSKRDKKTVRTTVCSSQRSNPQPGSKHISTKAVHDSFGTAQQPAFTEVWPTSDSESCPDGEDSESYGTERPKHSAVSGKSGVSSPLEGCQRHSVLARYVERFRHGQPQSREERQQVTAASAEKQDTFWWLSSSLPNTLPYKTTEKADYHHHERSPSPCRTSASTLSDVSKSEFDETEILHLQERASKLLPKGEGPLSDGSIPVSSEGLGSSEFSTHDNVEELVQPYSIPSLIKPAFVPGYPGSSWKSIIPPLVPPTHPEEDILFQWRSRRRIEQARDRRSQSPPSWHTPSLRYLSASRQASTQFLNPQSLDILQQVTHLPNTAVNTEHYRSGDSDVNPPPVPPAFVTAGASVSYPHSVTDIPAHTHFLCDVLPCRIQSSGTQQNVSQQLEKPEPRVMHKETQVTENGDTVSREPLCRRLVSSSSSSRALEETVTDRQTVPERNKKKKALREECERTAMAATSKKTSTRVFLHQKPSKNVAPGNENPQMRGNQEDAGANYSRDPKAPRSPVQKVLKKVVSKVLFPSEDLSPEPQRSDDCVSSRVPAPSPSPRPPRNSQNSAEVISQLLQEAEDSDGKEFEEDPLLEVLRKQRKWVKGQIRQVDSVLNEILEEQRVT